MLEESVTRFVSILYFFELDTYKCRFELPIIHCCGFSYLLTCGSDGDVRIYKDFDDSDPESVRAGENVTVLVVKVHACKLKSLLYWVKLKEY